MNAMISMFFRAILIGGFLGAASVTVSAQTFPSKTIRIISPYPSGSGPDQMMRVIAEQLTATWKQSVVLEARPGGNGIPAMEGIKAAPTDGHTLGVASEAQLTINPFLYRSLSYNPLLDFAPVTVLFSTPFYVVVSAKGPYRTLSDLIADAQSTPNKVSYGALSLGSSAHLGGALFALRINAQMVFVPYRDQQQLLINVATGELGWTFTTAASAMPLINSGLLRPLAIARGTRSAQLPEVPTLAEAGGPDIEVNSWLSLLAPRNTSTEIIEHINRTLIGAMSAPIIQERLRVFGFKEETGTPDDLTRIIHKDQRRNSELVKQTGASAH